MAWMGVPRTAPESESFAPHSILSPRLASPSSVLPLNTVALYPSTLAGDKNAPRGPEVAVPLTLPSVTFLWGGFLTYEDCHRDTSFQGALFSLNRIDPACMHGFPAFPYFLYCVGNLACHLNILY